MPEVVRRAASFDTLCDFVFDEQDQATIERFSVMLEELTDVGLLEKVVEEDRVSYSARVGLDWNEVSTIDSPEKQKVLLHLIENPKSFFILFNTQKGKLRLICKELMKWQEDKQFRPVVFVFVDNQIDLSSQSFQSMKEFLSEEGRMFELSSGAEKKHSVESIKTYIDAYANEPDYKMPIIVALANKTQAQKAAEIMSHVYQRVITRGSKLRYGAIFDEADKIYPTVRDTLKPYLVDGYAALYRRGWVSATEGNLLEEEYPESANAHFQQESISEEDKPNYRAIHLPGAEVKVVPIRNRDSNNAVAVSILTDPENYEHFHSKRPLVSGGEGYPKVIVNSDARIEQMNALGQERSKHGWNTCVYNQTGVTLFQNGMKTYTFRQKRGKDANPFFKKLNGVLFYIYKKFELDKKPLLIIGRRKVDRGLGFHYAPRGIPRPVTIVGPLGDIVSDGAEGLIWTDIILGRIEDKDTAVQKAGRLAGVIGQCPNSPLKFTYWTDKDTRNKIITHNMKIDEANNLSGAHSALQAIIRAEHVVRTKMPTQKHHEIDPKLFRVFTTEEEARNYCKKLDYDFRMPTRRTDDGFYKTSLNKGRDVVSLLEAIRAVPKGYGTNKGEITWRTFYPCYTDITNPLTLRFVVIIRYDRTTNLPTPSLDVIAAADAAYPSVTVPQEGDLSHI